MRTTAALRRTIFHHYLAIALAKLQGAPVEVVDQWGKIRLVCMTVTYLTTDFAENHIIP